MASLRGFVRKIDAWGYYSGLPKIGLFIYTANHLVISFNWRVERFRGKGSLYLQLKTLRGFANVDIPKP